MMNPLQQILNSIGSFSQADLALFEQEVRRKMPEKNEVLLGEGDVCKSFYYILSGAFFQYRGPDNEPSIIDLHVPGEWMFNQQSLTEQSPSQTTIRAFEASEIIELSLYSFHLLSGKSPAFLQFGKIFNQSYNRASLFDQSLTPAEKYAYINRVKPGLTLVFPVKMIASYLKMAPETLSRVRAGY